MRDLKRANAKEPAWKVLPGLGLEVFTPMQQVLVTDRQGRRRREERPVVADLLFVRARREDLDPIVAQTPTLQYRFKRGGAQGTPITVPTADMERFMAALEASPRPKVLQPQEVTPAMIGRRIRVETGPLQGLTAHLLRLRGARTPHLLIELEHLLAASITLPPDSLFTLLPD